jgi:hypothetical protein
LNLVELLIHADVEGKKLAWNLQVNVSADTVKLIWIKARKLPDRPLKRGTCFLSHGKEMCSV